MYDQIATATTSAGPVQAAFGFGDWVMVDGPSARNLQQRCARRRELHSVLLRAGVPPDEVGVVTKALWSQRPSIAIAESRRRARLVLTLEAVVALLVIAAILYVMAFLVPTMSAIGP